jgi:hypothetical protein
MSLPRRDFLLASTAALLALLDAAPAAAAGATRSRLFVSQWPLRKIGFHLLLGVIKQLSEVFKQPLQAFKLDQLAKEINQLLATKIDQLSVKEINQLLAKYIVSDGALAKLETLSKEAGAIDVRIDNFQVKLNGVGPSDERRQVANALALLKRALEVLLKLGVEVLFDHELLAEKNRKKLHALLAENVTEVLQLAEQIEVQISFELHSPNFTLYKTASFRRGYVHVEASIPQPVGQLNCLKYILDAEEKCGQSYITNTLGVDVCLGIREGRLVRRIAGRVIGNKEADLLCQLEGLVYRVINGSEDPDALARVIPEIMRRVEAQQF